MNKPRVFEAGDLIKMDFDAQAGHEQAGWRPALVISEGSYNSRSGLALVCPITSQAESYPFEVPLPEGCALTGVVLADQIKSVDLKARGAKYTGSAPKDVVNTVREYIVLLIGAR